MKQFQHYNANKN